MIKKANKKILFLLGLMVTGLISTIGGYIRTNYSKNDSLFVSSVFADVPYVPTCENGGYTPEQCIVYFCFPEGTKISTPEGDKEIQNITEGEKVYGFDVDNGETGTYVVVKTLRHNKTDDSGIFSPLLKITHELGSIILTDNHWVYRKNDREGDYANFDRAGMLKVGDKLTLGNGDESSILSIENGPDYETVYNLEVEGVHTYFASDVRVHNSGAGGCCGSTGCK